MAMFSFGAWFADAAFPEPKPATGIESASHTWAIGPEPASRGYTTGSVPYVSRQALTAAFAVGSGRRPHRVHETVDGDLVIAVLERRERPDEPPRRVRDDRSE